MIRKFFKQIHPYIILVQGKSIVLTPNANLACFKKSTLYGGIKIFSSLPSSLTVLKNDKATF